MVWSFWDIQSALSRKRLGPLLWAAFLGIISHYTFTRCAQKQHLLIVLFLRSAWVTQAKWVTIPGVAVCPKTLLMPEVIPLKTPTLAYFLFFKNKWICRTISWTTQNKVWQTLIFEIVFYCTAAGKYYMEWPQWEEAVGLFFIFHFPEFPHSVKSSWAP